MSAPTDAVKLIAKVPQKETRNTDLSGGAPPARAARSPKSARKMSELHATAHIKVNRPGLRSHCSSQLLAVSGRLQAGACRPIAAGQKWRAHS